MPDVVYAHPVPPDGGWGWFIVFASFGCNFVVDGIAYSFGVLIGDLGETFNSDKAQTALVGSLLCGMYLLNAPIAGLLVKRYGCRIVTITGAILASMSFLLSAYANSLIGLTVTYGGLGGFGFGFIYLPSIVSVGFYFEKRRALATGIALSGSGLGTMACSSIAKAVLDAHDWRYTLVILAGMVLHCAVLGVMMRPLDNVIEVTSIAFEDVDPGQGSIEGFPSRLRSRLELAQSSPALRRSDLSLPLQLPCDMQKKDPRIHRSYNDVYANTVLPLPTRLLMSKKNLFYSGSLRNLPIDEIEYTEVKKEVKEGKCAAVKNVFNDMFDFSVLRDWRFGMVVMGNVFGMLGLYVPYVYLTDRAVIMDVEAAQAAFLISVVGISNTIGRIASGIVSDLPRMKALWVNNICLLVAAIATLVLPHCLNYTTMVVYAATFGFFIAGYIAMTPVILCDILGLENLTSCFSLLTLVRGITAVAGTPIAGMIYDHTKSYDVSFYYGGCMLLLCLFFHALLMMPISICRDRMANAGHEDT